MENNGTVIKHIELNAPTFKVWEALTKPELTKKYFFDCESISTYEVGAPIDFVMQKDGQKRVCVTGVITLCMAEKMLAYTCFTPETETLKDKHTLVTMALIDEQNKTRLTITQGSFKEDKTRYVQSNQSWNFVLEGLKNLVEVS